MDVKNYNIRTKTTLFIVPLLGFKKEDVITEGFVNAYLKVESQPEEEGFIYLVYENDTVKHKVSKPILKKFTEGKYSLFTPLEKQKILAFWGVSKGSRLHNILNPRDMLFEQYGTTHNLSPSAQIWPKPLITEETFKR